MISVLADIVSGNNTPDGTVNAKNNINMLFQENYKEYIFFLLIGIIIGFIIATVIFNIIKLVKKNKNEKE